MTWSKVQRTKCPQLKQQIPDPHRWLTPCGPTSWSMFTRENSRSLEVKSLPGAGGCLLCQKFSLKVLPNLLGKIWMYSCFPENSLVCDICIAFTQPLTKDVLFKYFKFYFLDSIVELEEIRNKGSCQHPLIVRHTHSHTHHMWARHILIELIVLSSSTQK